MSILWVGLLLRKYIPSLSSLFTMTNIYLEYFHNFSSAWAAKESAFGPSVFICSDIFAENAAELTALKKTRVRNGFRWRSWTLFQECSSIMIISWRFWVNFLPTTFQVSMRFNILIRSSGGPGSYVGGLFYCLPSDLSQSWYWYLNYLIWLCSYLSFLCISIAV